MELLLEILKDGEFHSGADIGLALGVSRAAVWKRLQSLQLLGLNVDSVKGRGYRLSSGVELLDAKRIAETLAEHSKEVIVQCLFSTDSTNNYVMTCAEEGRAQNLFCFAEHQSAGRGRRGREWVSPFGANLYLSTCWSFTDGASALEGLSLVVGLAVRRAICRMLSADLTLKWPNDLLWNGHKIAGVLLEISGDPAGECQVVIGVGINLHLDPRHRQLISQPCADLYQIAGRRISKNDLAVALVDELRLALALFEKSGFSVFMDEWLTCDAYEGEEVSVQVASNHWLYGICRGVDQHGALLVEGPDGLLAYRGGEVSLRRRVNDSRH